MTALEQEWMRDCGQGCGAEAFPQLYGTGNHQLFVARKGGKASGVMGD